MNTYQVDVPLLIEAENVEQASTLALSITQGNDVQKASDTVKGRDTALLSKTPNRFRFMYMGRSDELARLDTDESIWNEDWEVAFKAHENADLIEGKK